MGKKIIRGSSCVYVTGVRSCTASEEVPFVVIDGLLQFWNEMAVVEVCYMMITLRRRLKGEKGLCWHCVPVVDYLREGNLLPLPRWLSRLLLQQVEREGVKTGWLLARDTAPKEGWGTTMNCLGHTCSASRTTVH